MTGGKRREELQHKRINMLDDPTSDDHVDTPTRLHHSHSFSHHSGTPMNVSKTETNNVSSNTTQKHNKDKDRDRDKDKDKENNKHFDFKTLRSAFTKRDIMRHSTAPRALVKQKSYFLEGI